MNRVLAPPLDLASRAAIPSQGKMGNSLSGGAAGASVAVRSGQRKRWEMKGEQMIRRRMKTPRQELIEMAAARLRVWRNETHIGNPQAHNAIEAIIDESRNCAFGTIGSAMLSYYRRASDSAIDRLISAVDNLSPRDPGGDG